MKFRKITAVLSALAVSAGILSTVPAANAADFEVNYAEALQKSMFFYQVQQAGALPEWNEVSWRADSMLKEDGTSADVVAGGWFDAGDHLKFAITNAYTASVLSWGIMQYKDAVQKAGLYDSYMQNLKWGLDYVAECDLGDKVIGTIGDGAFDHVWWGSAEAYIRKFNLMKGTEERPYDEITCVTTVAEMAAAMAGGYIVFKDVDPEAAAGYLEHAKSLFELANKTWEEQGDAANDDMGVQKEFYFTKNNQGTDNFVDELFYAANWMYMATGEQSYLDICEEKYIPIFPKESQSTNWKYTWGFCWDDTTQGAALLYAINTGKQEWIDHVSHHLDFWIDGYGGKQVNYTPDGHAWLTNWGSMRHMANTVMLAKIACDTIFADNTALKEKYDTWAKEQFDYAFGDNDLGMSYVIGMGEKNALNVHHRTTSGIHDDHWNELGMVDENGDLIYVDGWQSEYAHVLYGALEGGPSQDGTFKDNNASYENTEVAIDYNAGFTAALCAFIDDYGGEPLADFPPTETPKWAEWKIGACLNGKGDSYSEIKVWAMNHTAWPTRVAENVSYNYYFDISELLAAGLSADNLTASINSQQYQAEGEAGFATISQPQKYEGDPSGNIYFVKIQYKDGRAIMPTGQSEHRAEVQFRISIPDAIDGKSTLGAWDPTNDWSYEGIEDAPNELKYEAAFNDHITMYVDDVLVWGTEPDGTTPKPTEPDTKPANPTNPADTSSTVGKSTLIGDANCDGRVTIADATAIIQHLGNEDEYALSEQGKINGDIDGVPGITGADANELMKLEAGLITKFPVQK